MPDASTCSSSAPDRPGPPPRSPRTAPGSTCSSSTRPPSPRQDVRRRPHHRGAAPARELGVDLRGLAARGRGHRGRARRAQPAAGRALPLPAGRRRTPAWSPRAGPRRRARRARARGRRASQVREGAGLTATPRDDATTRVDRDPRPTAPTSRARFVVAADGHYSPCAACSTDGAPPDLGTWHAARQYFRGVDDPASGCSSSSDLLPGYAWVFPLPRRARQRRVRRAARPRTVRRARQLKALWRDLLARPALRRVLGPHAEPEGTVRGVADPRRLPPAALTRTAACSTWATPRSRRPDDRRRHRAGARDGDAGGAQRSRVRRDADAVAARVPHRRRPRRSAATCASRPCCNGCCACPPGARAAIRAAGLTDWTRRNFARWMFEDYPRALLLTPTAGTGVR